MVVEELKGGKVKGFDVLEWVDSMRKYKGMVCEEMKQKAVVCKQVVQRF